MALGIYLIKRSSPDAVEVDQTRAVVVAAAGPTTARRLIIEKRQYGDEGPDLWTNPVLSTCDRIGTAPRKQEKPYVILRDFNNG